MRILTVTNLYPTDADPTFGTFVGDQVQALRRHPRVESCEVLFVDGRSNRWNYLRAVPELRKRVRRETVDVVLAHYGLTGAVAITQRRVPVVITFHGGDLLETRWQRAVSCAAYRLAADAVSVSAQGLDQLPGLAHHVTCGIDLNLFQPRDRGRARSLFGVRQDELALLFPSSPERAEKMHPRFLEVASELRERGHRVHELQLRGLPRQQVPEIMAAADAMLLTSRREATPVSVMEALACGLPVVATEVGDVPSMLAGATRARVVDFDAGIWATTVEMLTDVEERERVPDPESRRFADREVADRLVAILERARSGRPSREVR
jgi:teichuronic acid biosynthesis glycosyltransferase TuaC